LTSDIENGCFWGKKSCHKSYRLVRSNRKLQWLGVTLMRSASLAWTVTLNLLFLPHAAFAVSFNCGLASQPVERMICSNPVLSSLDDQLHELYRNNSSGPRRTNQLDWLASRNQCQTDACVIAAYRERISKLSADVGNPGSERGRPEPVPQVPAAQNVQRAADRAAREAEAAEGRARARELATLKREEQRRVRSQQQETERRQGQERDKCLAMLGCIGDLLNVDEPPAAREARLRWEAEVAAQQQEEARVANETTRAAERIAGRQRAADRLASVRDLAAETDSLRIVARAIQQAQAAGDPTSRLDADEFQAYVAALQTEQIGLRHRIAARMAERLTGYTASIDTIVAMKQEGNTRLTELQRVGDPDTKSEYEQLYNQAVEKRMIELWKAFFIEAEDRVAIASKQGYEDFPGLGTLHGEAKKLQALWPVPAEIRSAHAKHEEAYTAAVDSMVQRSNSGLVA
jgi:uncharacterized protein